MSKIISIFTKKIRDDLNKEKDNDINDISVKSEENREDYSFEEIMKCNVAKKEEIAKEKLQANKKVLRDYRIK